MKKQTKNKEKEISNYIQIDYQNKSRFGIKSERKGRLLLFTMICLFLYSMSYGVICYNLLGLKGVLFGMVWVVIITYSLNYFVNKLIKK